jgi:hypothetical protein
LDLRAGLDKCGISRPPQDSIPGPPSPQAVAIPTILSGPTALEITSYKPITEWLYKMHRNISLTRQYGVDYWKHQYQLTAVHNHD